jgi:hypothetical protein
MEMTKAKFLETMRSERERWEALLSQIDAEKMEHPGVAGNWSARDIIVHVTAYERGLVECNAAILEEKQACSLKEIEIEAGRVFERLMALVKAIPEEELLEAGRSEWYVKPRWGEQRPLWECIADDSYRHYRQHVEDIRRWLKKEASQ